MDKRIGLSSAEALAKASSLQACHLISAARLERGLKRKSSITNHLLINRRGRSSTPPYPFLRAALSRPLSQARYSTLFHPSSTAAFQVVPFASASPCSHMGISNQRSGGNRGLPFPSIPFFSCYLPNSHHSLM